MLTSQEAMRRLFDGLVDRAGNMPPLPGIYPDYSAPIIRSGAESREPVVARWGMPTPQYLVGKKVDRGVTNIRQTTSSHWRARPVQNLMPNVPLRTRGSASRAGACRRTLPEKVRML